MGIIYKLTLTYMRKNRKRTKATIIGIAGTLVVLSTVCFFANTLLCKIRSDIAEDQGDYHAVFHKLNSDQYMCLTEIEKIKMCQEMECESHGDSEGICAAVEMKKVNWSIFSATQKLAKKIGMKELAKNEWTELPYRKTEKYGITYHTELLEYYGISQNGRMGVGALINLILVLLMLMGCVLIYNAYANSVFEKLKYLGTLGSIGASKIQKAGVIYWEGVLEGIAGIPIGIVIGVILTHGIFFGLQKVFLYEEPILVIITLKMIVTLVILGCVMIFLACSFPARKAMHASNIELITQQYSIDTKMRSRTNLLGKHNILGTAGRLAIKNVWVRRKNYIINGVLLVLTFCLILDGMAVMRGINGDYYPRDTRKRKDLHFWMELYTMDDRKIKETHQVIKKLPEVTSVSLERNLDLGGVLLAPEYIQKDLEKFEISSTVGFTQGKELSQTKKIQDMYSGKWVEGYYLRTVLVGVDKETFQNYVISAGYEMPQKSDQSSYQVLIEDYVEVKTAEGVSQRSVLDLQSGGKFNFYYSRYGDLENYSGGTIDPQRDEIRTGSFDVIGSTQNAPPYPYFSGMQDNITGYQERTLGICYIYMSMDDFEKLLKDPAYCETYGEHPTDTSAFNYEDYKSIATYLKFDKRRLKNTEDGTVINRVFKNEGKSAYIKEDQIFRGKIEKIAEEIGLQHGIASDFNRMLADGQKLPENDTYVVNSRELWKKEQYFQSKQFFILVLGYGMLLLITVLSLTNIFQNISTSMRVRRREFSVYQSVGMSQAILKKMLCVETAIYGIAGCLVGIPISFLVLYQVYESFKTLYEIVWKTPWDMLPIQLSVAVLLIFAPVFYAMSQLRHLNIIESIRNENM